MLITFSATFLSLPLLLQHSPSFPPVNTLIPQSTVPDQLIPHVIQPIFICTLIVLSHAQLYMCSNQKVTWSSALLA